MDDVKVIATRFTDRPKTDPDARLFKIDDHIKIGEAYNRSSRLYVGDDFRATLITLSFSVHPRDSVHGLYNTGSENLTYIALSVGK